MIVFANHFLAGALISLLIPGLALISVVAWYTRTVLRLGVRETEGRGEGGAVTGASATEGAAEGGAGGPAV